MAAVVAAFGNFQVSIVARRADNTGTAQLHIAFGAIAFHLARAVGGQALHNGGQSGVGANAHNGVHFRHFAHNLGFIALSQAAGHDHLQVGVLLLILAGHQNVFNGFLFSGLDKAAGVDNNNVRLFGVRNRLVARLDQRVAEYISIDLVFGASKGNNCNIHVWLFLSLFSVCYVGLCRLLGQNSGKAIRSVH